MGRGEEEEEEEGEHPMSDDSALSSGGRRKKKASKYEEEKRKNIMTFFGNIQGCPEENLCQNLTSKTFRTSSVKLERVLGLTVSSNASLATAPSTGEEYSWEISYFARA